MEAAPVALLAPPYRPAPEAPVLPHDEVHVWRAALDQDAFRIQALHRTLAADERARAGNFHFDRDRERFIVARGVLRAILGAYLNRPPESLSFRYGPHGKPTLATGSEPDAIRFSVSHTHGAALYAVARGREVGIDIERIRSDLAIVEITERFFSPREAARLRALPAAGQPEAFFRYWTRMEAYIKALGGGLSIPLDRRDVTMATGESGAVIVPQRDASRTFCWSVQELPAGPGHAAALAVAGQGWTLSCWQWPEQGLESA